MLPAACFLAAGLAPYAASIHTWLSWKAAPP